MHARPLSEAERKVVPRQPFNVIFRGPPGDVLREGPYILEVEGGPGFRALRHAHPYAGAGPAGLSGGLQLTDRTIAGPERKGRGRGNGARSARPQAFELAVARHRAGRLEEAEQLYRAVLKLEPDHFGALHYLGLACTQAGKFDEAEALLQRAVALEPRIPPRRTPISVSRWPRKRRPGRRHGAVRKSHRAAA